MVYKKTQIKYIIDYSSRLALTPSANPLINNDKAEP